MIHGAGILTYIETPNMSQWCSWIMLNIPAPWVASGNGSSHVVRYKVVPPQLFLWLIIPWILEILISSRNPTVKLDRNVQQLNANELGHLTSRNPTVKLDRNVHQLNANSRTGASYKWVIIPWTRDISAPETQQWNWTEMFTNWTRSRTGAPPCKICQTLPKKIKVSIFLIWKTRMNHHLFFGSLHFS